MLFLPKFLLTNRHRGRFLVILRCNGKNERIVKKKINEEDNRQGIKNY